MTRPQVDTAPPIRDKLQAGSNRARLIREADCRELPADPGDREPEG